MIANVYKIRPEAFKPHFETAACYLEIEGRLLLLECSPTKPEPGKWGVPAGKIDAGETPEKAAQRELFEETGIVSESSDIRAVGELYLDKNGLQFTYHMFQVLLKTQPKVLLSQEHTNYIWATPKEVSALPLMGGALEALYHYKTLLAPETL